MKKNALIDGNNIANIAWFASQNDPRPLSFVRIFFDLLSSDLGRTYSDSGKYIVFDGSSARRKKIFPDYKANRSARDPETSLSFTREDCDVTLAGESIKNQFKLIERLVKLTSISTVRVPNEEADDVIASFVRKNSDSLNMIFSTDKDYFLLASGKTVLFSHDGKVFEKNSIEAYYKKKFDIDIQQKDILAYKALTGDTSDNVKGVFRLRKKMAALLSRHSSYENMVSSSEFAFLSASEKSKFIESEGIIRRNFIILNFFDDVEYNDHTVPGSNDKDSFISFFNENGISVDFSSFFPDFGKHSLVPDFLSDI